MYLPEIDICNLSIWTQNCLNLNHKRNHANKELVQTCVLPEQIAFIFLSATYVILILIAFLMRIKKQESFHLKKNERFNLQPVRNTFPKSEIKSAIFEINLQLTRNTVDQQAKPLHVTIKIQNQHQIVVVRTWIFYVRESCTSIFAVKSRKPRKNRGNHAFQKNLLKKFHEDQLNLRQIIGHGIIYEFMSIIMSLPT